MKPCAIAITAILWGSTVAEAVPIVTFENPAGGDYRLASITGLLINGTAYDADFLHGGLYADFESFATSLGTSPITFSSPATAGLAVDAIRAAINAQNVDASGATFPTTIEVPWGLDGPPMVPPTTVLTASSIPASFNPLRYDVTNTGTGRPLSQVQDSTTEWTAFTASAVPEPGTLTLCSLLAIFAGLQYRRRRGQAAKST